MLSLSVLCSPTVSMARRNLCSILVCFCLFLTCDTRYKRYRLCRRFPSRSVLRRCSICDFFHPKSVTLVIRNILREPMFDKAITLNCTRFKFLFSMMQEAADMHPAFKFTVSYFPSPLGFFVNTINGVTGNFTRDQTWWAILGGDGRLTPLGVSSYKPSNGETVTFNFTQGGGHST